jgi:hypothetical protein
MGLLDTIQPTQRNKMLGLLADAVQGVDKFASKPFGYDNPPVNALMQLLGVRDVGTTLDNMSYGGSLGTGSGMTWKPKDETVNAAMALAPLVQAAKSAAPIASRLGQNAIKNAMVPRILSPQAGVIGSGLPMDQASKVARQTQMGMESGWYRGGDTPVNGKRNGPMYTQDLSEATAYAKGRDLREYSIPASGFLNAERGYPSRLPNDVAKILDDPYYGKVGEHLASQLRTYGPEEGITGGQLWQALESRFGNDGAAEVLQKLKAPNGQPAFKGAKGMTRGDEAYVFKNAPVRDANKAAFDPSKYGVDDIYGKANLPFMGLLGGSSLAGSYLLHNKQQDQ